MRVGIQGYRYGGVAQKLLDQLRVYASAQEQGGAGVPKVVEAYLRQTGPFEERLEGTLDKILGVDGRACVR